VLGERAGNRHRTAASFAEARSRSSSAATRALASAKSVSHALTTAAYPSTPGTQPPPTHAHDAAGANVAGVVRVDAASRRMLRARDRMDRSYDKPLDVAALARVALTSEAHFIRTFKETFGETPHRYLQRRRLERAMALLRETERPVTEICLDVGFTSLGSFSRTFTHVIGMSPSAYREAWRTGAGTAGYVPTCVVMSWTRPRGSPQGSSFGEANRNGSA
jgi:AraC-like DNA-binding protein